MPVKKDDVLGHFRLLHRALDQADMDAILSFSNFSVLIRGHDQDRILYPQFLVVSEGEQYYDQTFSNQSKKFIGWLPYYNKRWELASDKLEFKRYAQEHGLATPEFSLAPSREMADVLIKCDQSSFGNQIQGPFRSSAGLTLDVDEGEYFERFISGKILKIWYWDNMPACMEMDVMPFVVGDGVSPIKELLLRRLVEQGKLAAMDAPCYFSKTEQVLAYDGKNLESVLARHDKQRVEIRYGSNLRLPCYRKVVNLQKRMPEDLKENLLRIGEVAWQGIPAEIRNGTVFTIDAILDAERKIWVLEMNSNPFVHPLVYGLMGQTLFKGQTLSPEEMH